MRSSCRVGLALALLAWAGVCVSAQEPPPSLTGVVKDTSDQPVPGAAVEVKREVGGSITHSVTDAAGAFSVSSLVAGAYSVTVTHAGFTPSVPKSVRVSAATTAKVAVTLERPGEFKPISTAVTTTVLPQDIERLPFPTRNVLDALTLQLSGVDTTTINRASTAAGLPSSAFSITMDGVNVQDNFAKTIDGFFARVALKQDAMGQVSVSTATPTAEAAAQGAVRIQFVTRSGTDQFLGTAYEYHRDAHLDANSWINRTNGLTKDRATVNEFGASEGGPVRRGSTRAFFFVNDDELRATGGFTAPRTILQAPAQAGLFSYAATTAAGAPTVRSVNVLALAAANGFLSTPDPTVAALLAQIRAATAAGGAVRPNGGDLLTSLYLAQDPTHRVEREPTVRVDVNFGAETRLNASYARQNVTLNPNIGGAGNTAFPGFPNHGSQVSQRNVSQAAFRSSLGAHLMNEVRVGGAWGPSSFGADSTAAEFANQGGFNLNLPLVSPATATNTATRRDLSNWNFNEALTWLTGRQQFTFGGDFTRVDLRQSTQNLVPTVSFGLDTLDPANAIFSTANFAGASTEDLANARSLYAMLVGSVSGINGNVSLNPATGHYDPFGAAVMRGRQDEGGVFTQYAWRPRSNFTLNAGVRWELQRPFVALDNTSFATATIADVCGVSGLGGGTPGRVCNIFKPGTLTTEAPQFTALAAGQPVYRVDKGNIAPNIGLAWRPNVESGPLRALFGDPLQATFRMAYGIAFNRDGMADFFDLYGANPGAMVSLNRNAALGNLLTGGGTLPLLLRNPALLGLPPACAGAAVPPACTPATASFPLSAANQSVNIFDPDLKVPFARSYSIGFERSLGKDTTLDLRYVGTRNHRQWMTENWNEQNLFESGFLDQYKLAQANLSANIASGRGATFQYAGPGTGTAPLPIYLAFLTGRAGSLSGDSTLYTGSAWSNPAMIARLSVVAPNPVGALNDLWSDAARRANALASGLPANQIVMNPDIGANSANVTRSAGETHDDSLQVEVRHRLSHSFSISANYTFEARWASTLNSIRFAPALTRSLDVVPHALKLNWTYELPFGHGRRFGGGSAPWVDGLLGGWQWNGTGRVQSGRLLALSGVRLVGMNQQELQREFHIRFAADKTVTTLPDDIILNTRRAFSPDPTSATGYSALGVPTGRYISPASTPTCIEVTAGGCGEPAYLYVSGPLVTRFDMSLRKSFPAGGHRSIAVEFDVLNVFNAINFTPVFQAGTSATLNQVMSSYQDPANTFDPGGRVGQLTFRIKW